MNRVKPNSVFGLVYWATLIAYLVCYVALSKRVGEYAITVKSEKTSIDTVDHRPQWYKDFEVSSKVYFDDFVKEVF